MWPHPDSSFHQKHLHRSPRLLEPFRANTYGPWASPAAPAAWWKWMPLDVNPSLSGQLPRPFTLAGRPLVSAAGLWSLPAHARQTPRATGLRGPPLSPPSTALAARSYGRCTTACSGLTAFSLLVTGPPKTYHLHRGDRVCPTSVAHAQSRLEELGNQCVCVRVHEHVCAPCGHIYVHVSVSLLLTPNIHYCI